MEKDVVKTLSEVSDNAIASAKTVAMKKEIQTALNTLAAEHRAYDKAVTQAKSVVMTQPETCRENSFLGALARERSQDEVTAAITAAILLLAMILKLLKEWLMNYSEMRQSAAILRSTEEIENEMFRLERLKTSVAKKAERNPEKASEYMKRLLESTKAVTDNIRGIIGKQPTEAIDFDRKLKAGELKATIENGCAETLEAIKKTTSRYDGKSTPATPARIENPISR